MTTHGRSPWASLETWSATAFLVGGLLWFLDTTLLGIELFGGVSILGTPGPVNPILYISGTIAASVGLLGFYPELVERTPWTARVSGAIVAIAGAAISLLLIWFISVTILNQPDPPFALLILSILGIALGFVLFGIAGVRTGVPSRTVGFLLLAVVATIITWIALSLVVFGGSPPRWTSPLVGVVMSVLLLTIGYTLRAERSATRSENPSRDSAMR